MLELNQVLERAKGIRLVVLDVDGVLTDGSIWTGENGELVKRFHTRDGLGIKMLQAAGIPVPFSPAVTPSRQRHAVTS